VIRPAATPANGLGARPDYPRASRHSLYGEPRAVYGGAGRVGASGLRRGMGSLLAALPTAPGSGVLRAISATAG